MCNKAFFKKSVNTFCSNVRSDLKDYYLAESIQIKMLKELSLCHKLWFLNF